MRISTDRFGIIKGWPVTRYTLENCNGMRLRILNYGGIITELHVPGRNGTDDVVLGLNTLDDYQRDNTFMGAVVGRVANRIANASMHCGGEIRQLDVNEPPHHLHGGFLGFHRNIWHAECYHDNGTICLRLQRISPDGECGYPGNLDMEVVYRLSTENVLSFEVTATSDVSTPVSVTQHSYFNLRGHDRGDIFSQRLRIFADSITCTRPDLIPTGEIQHVANSPYDFRRLTTIGPQQKLAEGFDTNYCLRGRTDDLKPAAELRDPHSGRVMNVATTLPGMQLYDGSHLEVKPCSGKANTAYPRWSGLCLETQHFPDAINQPAFPSPVLNPQERYQHTTTYTFTIESSADRQ